MPKTQEIEATQLLTVAEAAALARCSKPHLWRLIRDGEIEAFRIGEGHGPIRIPRAEFLHWLYGDEVPASSRRKRTAGEEVDRLDGAGVSMP
jgi:excisionase family DNA binding protein